MDSFSAMLRGMANRDKPTMVFDWHKAARLIRERKPKDVGAGLRSDWEYTGGSIYENGKPTPKDETYVYLASTWAVPEIALDGELEPCYVMQADVPNGEKWDSSTYWPQSALDILNADDSLESTSAPDYEESD